MHRVAKSTFIRGALLLPFLVANVIVALLWFWMLDYQMGIVNEVISWMGLPRIAFFGSEQWAIPTIAFVNVWRHMGYTALLIFAGLQSIPNHVYEVAILDGASPTRTFWSITMPLLRPVLVLVLVVTVIGSFQVFDTVAVTTGGGPVNASRVIQMYIYQKAFGESDFGYASALSVILFLILALVAFVQMKFLKGNEIGSGLRNPRHEHLHTHPQESVTNVSSRSESRYEAVQLAPRRRLGPGGHRRRRHRGTVPVDAAHRAVQQPFAGLQRRQPAAGGLQPGAPSSGSSACRAPEEAIAEGGSGAAINFWLYLRNSVIFASVTTAGPGLLQRDGSLRLLPAPLARPEQRLRPLPGHHDGPADLHRAAQLPHDQEPGPAQHLRRT